MAHLGLVLLLVVAFAGSASANYIGYVDKCKSNATICTGREDSFIYTGAGTNGCKYLAVGCYVDGCFPNNYTAQHPGEGCAGNPPSGGSKVVYGTCTYSDKGFTTGSGSSFHNYTSCASCTVVNSSAVNLQCIEVTSNNVPVSSCPNPTTAQSGICGDPHFSAPGGILFDWSGNREQSFSIISDTDFQLNAHFIGERNNSGNVEGGTWIQEYSMGYMDGNTPHFLSVGIDQEKDFETQDVFYFTFDGKDIPVGSGTAEYKWTSPDGMASIFREPHKRAKAYVLIDGSFEATFYPRVESRIQLEPLGKYLDMDMEELRLSRHAHGVLGQMFRPDIIERRDAVTANISGHGFLVEGKTEDYRVSSLQSYDSLFNQFNLVAGVKIKSFSFLEETTGSSRKMLSPEQSTGEEPLGRFSAVCVQDHGSLVCS